MNAQHAIKSTAFQVAFCPPPDRRNLTRVWELKASEAINTLIDFRGALQRWLEAGRVNDTEFVAQLRRLEDAGLGGWVEEMVNQALAVEGGAV